MKHSIKIIFILAIVVTCTLSCKQQSQESRKDNLNITVSQAWVTDTVFKTPEAVFFDKERNVIYVANINGSPYDKDGNGFISKLKPTGEIEVLSWITGLDGPKGMGTFGNSLFVTDITRIVEINIAGDSILHTWEIEGSGFLNDIAIDNEGNVFFTDSKTSRIYVLKNGEVSVWLAGETLNGPNGLYFDGDIMWLASSGHEQFQSVNMNDQSITVVANGIGHGDGIAPDGLGNFIVSDWNGQVFYIDPAGEIIKLIDTRDQKINSADIDFIIQSKLIVVPTFFDNRVAAYTLNY